MVKKLGSTSEPGFLSSIEYVFTIAKAGWWCQGGGDMKVGFIFYRPSFEQNTHARLSINHEVAIVQRAEDFSDAA